MSLYLYNTYNRKKELFNSIDIGRVKLYTCGPTVYDFSHIGNFRTFLFQDLLKRWLLHIGYEVYHVMNITDVDDKTIKRSREEDVDIRILTNKYESFFIDDIKWLKIIPADLFPRATEYISQMIKMIQNLSEKGFAYKDDDGSMYFSISEFCEYGNLSKMKIDSKKPTNRVLNDEYDKGSINDFALWKGWKNEDGNVVWDAPWGKGRPGWHIECSVMSNETLGGHFDIHCGGVDNIFPHHENEIAQSKCATGEKFVNYWLHSEHLMIESNKMSKSSGNYLTINELKEDGFSPESIRYQLLSGHYRTKILFSKNKKHESDKIIQRILDFYNFLKTKDADKVITTSLPEDYKYFEMAMNNDLDTPQAFAVFFKWMKRQNKKINIGAFSEDELGSSWNFLTVFNSIFGLTVNDELRIPSFIKKILLLRQKARANKDWKSSDSLRDELNQKGWIVEDTKNGQKIKKI